MTVNKWTETYTGKRWNLEDADKHPYCLLDIAHALSLICRFGGSCEFHYSVGQHSVLMADKMFELTKSHSYALDALFHDAAEAYIGDMKKPIKDCFPVFEKIEGIIDSAIRRRMSFLGVPLTMSPHTKTYDARILIDEKRQLMLNSTNRWAIEDAYEPLGITIHPYSAKDIQAAWLARVAHHSAALTTDGTHEATFESLYK